jgi:hypothetical protein
MTLEQINLRMDELAREHGRTERWDPRRVEIVEELRRLIQQRTENNFGSMTIVTFPTLPRSVDSCG